MPAPRLKIGAHTITQILRLAHVDDLARFVFVQVDAGLDGEILKFLFESQRLLNLTLFTISG
jgi:hypothetical protein